jgi:hypothetical protein
MMFSRELPWRRTFSELLLRGAISLVVCATPMNPNVTHIKFSRERSCRVSGC